MSQYLNKEDYQHAVINRLEVENKNLKIELIQLLRRISLHHTHERSIEMNAYDINRMNKLKDESDV
jgi:hypothetical protein